jgi:hypothetical protein
VAIRPSYIEALYERGLRLDRKAVMTTTAPLTPRLEARLYEMGAARIVDCYVATEIGQIGFRTSTKDPFTVMPGVIALEDEGELVIQGPTVAGYYENGRYIEDGVRYLGDSVQIDDFRINLLATTHTKAKVSGFSVPLEYVAGVARKALGLQEAGAFVEDGTLVLAYTGLMPSPEDAQRALSACLPWYWMPRRFVTSEVEVRSARESWSDVPVDS